ncbi:hypothetical protein K1719_044147 [Acacia pycnantha]|nr:hypothetical protein K1719_044147 [Acacia pycnantha]
MFLFEAILQTVGHVDRGCSDVSVRNGGDRRSVEGKGSSFGSWLCTAGVRTVEEVVVVCRKNWCEAAFLDKANLNSSSRRSWSPGKGVSSEGRPEEKADFGGVAGSGVGECQGQSQTGKEVGRAYVEEIGVNSLRALASEKGPNLKEESSGPVLINLSGPSLSNNHFNSQSLSLARSSSGGSSGESAKSKSMHGYIVEFPSEAESGLCLPPTSVALSPVSTVALSLQRVQLKRPYEPDTPSDLSKRQRKLVFEDPVSPSPLRPVKAPIQRGRHKSYRSVKSLARCHLNSSPSGNLCSSLNSVEIDFPDSWFVDSVKSDQDVVSSSTCHNSFLVLKDS